MTFLKARPNRSRAFPYSLIHLRGPLSPEDFELVAKYLCPTGLMVQSVVGSTPEARELSQAASRVFGA